MLQAFFRGVKKILQKYTLKICISIIFKLRFNLKFLVIPCTRIVFNFSSILGFRVIKTLLMTHVLNSVFKMINENTIDTILFVRKKVKAIGMNINCALGVIDSCLPVHEC